MSSRTPSRQSSLVAASVNNSSKNSRFLGPRSSGPNDESESNVSPLVAPVTPSIFRRNDENLESYGITETTAETTDPPDFGKRQNWFPKAHLIKVDLSEPRDVLQSERTFLGFIRFALSLFFTAIGLILGFHLKSDNNGDPGEDGDHKPHVNFTLFSKVVSFLLVFLAFSTLVMAGVSYFSTVRRYSQRKIRTSGNHNALSVACVTAVVVTLAGLNVSLIVERYLQDQ